MALLAVLLLLLPPLLLLVLPLLLPAGSTQLALASSNQRLQEPKY
jgi:hypothetical protein